MAAKKVNKGSLVQQITELEQEIVKPRAWQLNGEIKGSGTFNELKQAIPNFAIQAERVNL
jgi:U3 small nucleolar ribonucleoprotein component